MFIKTNLIIYFICVSNIREHKAQYVSFPLCFLALNEDIPQKIQTILIFGLTNTHYDEKEQRFIDKNRTKDNKKYFLKPEEITREQISYVLHTFDYFRIKFPRIEDIKIFLSIYENAYHFYQSYVQNYGQDAFSQVHINVCAKTIRNSISYDIFALSCAVRSVLGKVERFKRITLDTIAIRMTGYKSKEVLEDIMFDSSFHNFDERFTIPKQYDNNKISRIRNKSAELNFFRFVTLNKRMSYYTTKIETESALIKAIKNRRSGKKRKDVVPSFDPITGEILGNEKYDFSSFFERDLNNN